MHRSHQRTELRSALSTSYQGIRVFLGLNCQMEES